MKQRKRKLTTVYRHERLMTGGGPTPVQQNDPVMEFMDATNSNIDVEIDCPYDSTAVFEKENNVETVGTSTIKKRVLISDDDENDNNIIESHIPDHSQHHSDHIPSTSDHLSPPKKRTSSRNKSIENITDEKELRLIKMREAIKQQQELHAEKMKIAEVEEKIVLLKLLKEEEALKLINQ